MKMKSYLSIGLFFVQCLNILSYSQSHDYNWLVGYGITDDKEKPFYGLSLMDFSSIPLSINYIVDKAVPDLLYDFDYLCISDSRGEFRYFTNGCKILNNKYQVMQNGDSINPGPIWEGSDGTYYPLRNGTMFLPYPGDSNKYYLFHKGSFQGGTANFGYLASNVLYYSLIDSRLDNGLGSVIEKNVVLLRDTINESQMAACRHANGRDWWIPIRHGDKNLYFIYLLDPKGVHLQHKQYIGLHGPGHAETYNGNASFSHDGTKYASCLRDDFIQLFNFDTCTGMFYNPIHLTSIVQDTNS
jgi:hypothetical protein